MTQFAGTQYDLEGLTQNGVAPGAFTGISHHTPTATSSPTTTTDRPRPSHRCRLPRSPRPTRCNARTASPSPRHQRSGNPFTAGRDTNGAGSLIIGSVESSNVDIATQFSDLIVAQQAYGANAKVVTTADQMLQTTINMIQ